MKTVRQKKIQLNNIITYSLFISILIVSIYKVEAQVDRKKSASPFLGWNSYDSYGTHINEKLTNDNLEAFINKLKPYGYEYFVIDAGWYSEYDFKKNQVWPVDGDKKNVSIDEYGRYIPSNQLFPNGFKAIIERAHNSGVKFGIHLMRGIPRKAFLENTPIKGTIYYARDIANIDDTCSWSDLNYGIDMSKPGAQEYYNSVIELISEWGVDFVKYDDIVHKPKEINAVADAIENGNRHLVLSLSPGDDVNPDYFETYKRADMIRISGDIWDLRKDINTSFKQWEQILPYSGKGFWLDLDMIPFGHIRINYPPTQDNLKSTRGYERMDNFNYAQKKTFITQRAMAASPLFMGGSLVSSPNVVFELITNSDMLACVNNGITGKLKTRIEGYSEKVDVWQTYDKKNDNNGWIGVFNRNPFKEIIKISKEELGLDSTKSYQLYDIWNKRIIEDLKEHIFEISSDDVIFIRYEAI